MGLPGVNGCAYLSGPGNQEAVASTFRSLPQASIQILSFLPFTERVLGLAWLPFAFVFCFVG